MQAQSPAFEDRLQAGKALAKELRGYRDLKDVIVLAIAKEGVEVASGLAHGLGVPLDLVLARLLLVPGEREIHFGAVTRGVITLDEALIAQWELTRETVQQLARDANQQARNEMARLRARGTLPELAGKTVILADDGGSFGFAIISAILWARRANAREIVIAMPVGPLFEIHRLGQLVDDIVCLVTPETWSMRIANYYRRQFDLNDAKIKSLLAERTG
jgi:putative phosphoribosyl transferase